MLTRPAQLALFDPNAQSSFFEDFLNVYATNVTSGIMISPYFTASVAGTNASVSGSLLSGAGQGAIKGAGWCIVQAGTQVGGSCTIRQTSGFRPTDGPAQADWRMFVDALSTPAQEYTTEFQMDFGLSTVSVKYDRATDGVNWVVRHFPNGLIFDTGIPVVARTPVKISVKFLSEILWEVYMNDVFVGNIDGANLPADTTNLVKLAWNCNGSVGVGNKLVYVDYCNFQQIFTTPR